MANRYWVGGSGTWNTSSTTNWSATSGGAGGASVPTAADSVFFDQASTYNVTMTGALTCLDITVSAGTVSFLTGTTPTLAISGSMTLLAGTVWSSTGAITFNATTTGKTITTNGVTFSTSFAFNGVGGGWTLGSALTTTTGAAGTITLTAGTLDTSSTGNYSITGAQLTVADSASATLNLNASTITLGGSSTNSFGANCNLNAGTSTIVSTGRGTFAGGGKTFYNVTFSYTPVSAAGTTITITGSNTFNNLSFNGSMAGAGVHDLIFTANGTTTINGTFTIGVPGESITRRRYVRSSTSNTVGGTTTISAAAVSLTNVDFQDIIATGAAGTWTGTSIGDCGNNSGIIGDTPKTVYWNLTGAAVNFTDTAWATTSSGTPAAANYPLPQDTAVFTNTGVTSGSTLSVGNVNLPSLDFSARTTAMTLSLTNSTLMRFFGDIILYSNITMAATTPTVLFQGRSRNQSLNFAGKSFNIGSTGSLAISCATASINLLSNVVFTNGGANPITFNSGTIALNNLDFKISGGGGGITLAQATGTKVIAFGTSGTITVSGGGSPWNSSVTGGFSYTGNSSIIVDAPAETNMSITGGTLTEAQAQNFKFINGTYTLNIQGSVGDLDFTGFSGSISTGTSATIYGSVIFSSTMTITTTTTNNFTFATTGSKTITTNGLAIGAGVVFNGVGGTWVLNDNFTIPSGAGAITHTNGTLDLNGKTITLTDSNYVTGVGTKNITFNGGTMLLNNSGLTAFNNAQPTGFTTTAGTGAGYIIMASAVAKTFVGGGSVYNCTLRQGGTGTLTITGSNTFADIDNTVQPATITFSGSPTITLGKFSLKGISGSRITITGIHTLSMASGIVQANYLSITNSTATGGARWEALNSLNVSGNSGWLFPRTVARIASNGSYYVSGLFDEITLTGSPAYRIANSGIAYATLFDEITINPINNGVARQIYSNGTVMIAGSFDEVTGIT